MTVSLNERNDDSRHHHSRRVAKRLYATWKHLQGEMYVQLLGAMCCRRMTRCGSSSNHRHRGRAQAKVHEAKLPRCCCCCCPTRRSSGPLLLPVFAYCATNYNSVYVNFAGERRWPSGRERSSMSCPRQRTQICFPKHATFGNQRRCATHCKRVRR